MNTSMKKSMITLMALSTVITAQSKVHTVTKGDTLSDITKTELGAPIYGNKGNLSKLLKANTNISNPNLILVDQKIQIPFEDKVNSQLAGNLKNKLIGNVVQSSQRNSKWDFSLDTKIFTTTLGITSNNLKTTDSVNSGLSYGAKANVYYEGSEWYQTRLELGIDKVVYGQKKFTLSQDNSALSSAILGSEFLYKNQILFGLYGGVTERIIATKLNNNSLDLTRKAMGQFGLGTSFVLDQTGKNKMALSLNGNYLMENSGREYIAEISVIRSRLTVGPFLNYTSLSTDVGNQENLSTGLNLSYQL